jgi:hypothetical protein
MFKLAMKNKFLNDCQKWMKENPANASVHRIQHIIDLVAKRNVKELNKALGRYAYRPRVELSRNSLSSGLVLPKFDSHDEAVEVAAVHLLIFNAGLLKGRPVTVRECETCGDSFTCTLDRQQFCSNICRQRRYDRQPENVESRKKNYQTRKSQPSRNQKNPTERKTK